MGHMKKKRLRERKQSKDPLKGWTMTEEPIRDLEHFQTEIDRWLSVKGAVVLYDDYGAIEAVFHPSCETNPKPHFHAIIGEMKDDFQNKNLD